MIYTIHRITEQGNNKQRPEWFDKLEIFKNFQKTFINKLNVHRDDENVYYHLIFDNCSSQFVENFVAELEWIQGKNLNIQGTTLGNCASFMYGLDIALKLKDEDIVYFLEDDYLHRSDLPTYEIFDYVAKNILNQGDLYFTGYDHPDKYTEMYNGLQSQIFALGNHHFRATPSTTMTFMASVKTLRKHQQLFIDLVQEKPYPHDHLLFTTMASLGGSVLSAIPGLSTHVELPYFSPTYDWKKEIIIK